MAKNAKPAEEVAVEAPKKKSKKLLIIIIALVLVLVLAGGGAALFLLKKHDNGEDEGETADEAAPKKKESKKDKNAVPVFISLDPFTVNLVPENGDQYLQVALSLEIEDAHAEVTVKGQTPKIRNNITLMLSGKKASELLPKEGKEKLAEELRNTINSVIEPPTRNKRGEMVMPEGPVKSVLFTSFIIQ
jgi:flagellar FliL protein